MHKRLPQRVLAFLRGRLEARRLRGRDPAQLFTEIYGVNRWGNSESRSGHGSSLSGTRGVREQLPALLCELGVESMLDIPCGDFNWMKTVDIGKVTYTGADLVPEIVEANRRYETPGVRFVTLDLLNDRLPEADLLMVRDCLVHFSFADCHRAIRNIAASSCRYLLATTFSRPRNKDIETGQWRPLDMGKPPFEFPSPLRTISEMDPDPRFADKALALWRVSDLKAGV